MCGHTERELKAAPEAALTGSGGYETRSPYRHEPALALFPSDVAGFLSDCQPAGRQALEALLGPRTNATVLDGHSEELERDGTPNNEGIESAIAAHLSIAPRQAFASRPVLAPTVSMANIPK